jgi:hypothetical protein
MTIAVRAKTNSLSGATFGVMLKKTHTNLLQKIRNQVKLAPCRNPALPYAKIAGSVAGAFIDQQRAKLIFSPLVPCNQLKSLDSDERIQGNPTVGN